LHHTENLLGKTFAPLHQRAFGLIHGTIFGTLEIVEVRLAVQGELLGVR
jgi:hypothetical protein